MQKQTSKLFSHLCIVNELLLININIYMKLYNLWYDFKLAHFAYLVFPTWRVIESYTNL